MLSVLNKLTGLKLFTTAEQGILIWERKALAQSKEENSKNKNRI